MKLTKHEIERGWWLESKATIPAKLPADGAIVIFDQKDVEAILDANYPHDERVWWFNEMRNREIAERNGGTVICNPQILWRHFLEWRSKQNA